MEKKLFEIDGYRIWAYTYDEAYQNYLQILRFQIMIQRENNLDDLITAIQNETEWLTTTEDDEIECIGIENLEGILNKFFGFKLKISQS